MRNKIIITSLILLLIIVLSVFVFLRTEEVPYELVKAKRGDIVKEVSASGNIEMPASIDYRFKNTDKVIHLDVYPGQRVKPGHILARQDATGLEAEIAEIEANIKVQEAMLNQLMAGASQEEIFVSEAGVEQARIAHENAIVNLDKAKKIVAEDQDQAEKNYNDILSELPENTTIYEQSVVSAESNLANTKETYLLALNSELDSAPSVIDDKLSLVRVALDNIDKLLNDDDAENNLSVKDLNFLQIMKSDYSFALTNLSTAQLNSKSLINKNREVNFIFDVLDISLLSLEATHKALNSTYTVLEYSVTSSDFSQADLDAYKNLISSQRAIISTALSSLQSTKQDIEKAEVLYDTNVVVAENFLQTALNSLENEKTRLGDKLRSVKVNSEQKISSAESQVESTLKAYELAKAQLRQVNAGARQSDIALSRAQIEQARLARDRKMTQLNDRVLIATATSTVSQVNIEIGELATPDIVIVSLLPEGVMQIDLDISESNIVDVAVEQVAKISFDALGNGTFLLGHVEDIEPAETVIGGAVYYKAIVLLDGEDRRVKPGMSADVWIEVGKKKDVLVLPASAIKEKNTKSFVDFFIDGEKQEREVETGIANQYGMVEIISGAREGDSVVTGLK